MPAFRLEDREGKVVSVLAPYDQIEICEICLKQGVIKLPHSGEHQGSPRFKPLFQNPDALRRIANLLEQFRA